MRIGVEGKVSRTEWRQIPPGAKVARNKVKAGLPRDCGSEKGPFSFTLNIVDMGSKYEYGLIGRATAVASSVHIVPPRRQCSNSVICITNQGNVTKTATIPRSLNVNASDDPSVGSES
jgi:hypothetical protein